MVRVRDSNELNTNKCGNVKGTAHTNKLQRLFACYKKQIVSTPACTKQELIFSEKSN